MGTRVISASLTLRDRDFSSNLRRASERTDDLGRAVTLVGNRVRRFSDSMGQSFRNISNSAQAVSFASLSAGAVALGSVVAGSILEMDESFAMLSAKTGKTGEELKGLENVAKNVFVSGFGDSLTTVTDDIGLLQNMFKGIGEKDLTSLAKNTATISKIMGAETKEVGRAIKGMTENFEGLSNSDAADLITTAFQKTGDYSDNLLDTFNEYSVHFSKMGLSAQEFTGILSNASGAFDMDKVGDAVGEFGKRAVDGSKGTADGFKAIGLNADEMGSKIAQGGESANNAFVATLAGLASITDEQERHVAGTSLFGTQWEDISGDVVLAMAEGKDSIKDFSGATEKAGKTITGTFGSRVSQVWRDLKVSLSELANEKGAKDLLNSLAKGAESFVPKIVTGVQAVIDFANGIKNNWGAIKEIVLGASLAIGAFAVGMGVLKVVSTVTTLITGFRNALALGTVAQWAMNTAMLANPAGLVIAGIAGLIAIGVLLYRNWDTVKAKAGELWAKLRENPFAQLLWNISPVGVAVNVIAKGFSVAKSSFESMKKALSNFKMPAWVGSVGSAISGAKDKVSSGMSKIKNALPSFAVGTDNVSQDMTANIHKGEMIIPARQAENLRKSGYDINNIDKNKTAGVAVAGGTTKSNSFVININGSNASTEQILSDLVPKLKLALANI